MPIQIGDRVGFYRQKIDPINNQEYTWSMEYFEGVVIEFINPSIVKVKTKIKNITLPYVDLASLEIP